MHLRVVLRGTRSRVKRRTTRARSARATTGVYVSQPAPKDPPKANHKARAKPMGCLGSHGDRRSRGLFSITIATKRHDLVIWAPTRVYLPKKKVPTGLWLKSTRRSHPRPFSTKNDRVPETHKKRPEGVQRKPNSFAKVNIAKGQVLLIPDRIYKTINGYPKARNGYLKAENGYLK